MNSTKTNHLIVYIFQILFICGGGYAAVGQQSKVDTVVFKSGKNPKYNFSNKFLNSSFGFNNRSPFNYFSNQQVKSAVSVQNNNIVEQQMINNYSLDQKRYASVEEFNQSQTKEVNRSYWRAYAKSLDGDNSLKSRGLFPKIDVPPALDRIFGGGDILFKPNISLLLDVGYMTQFIDNPAIPIQLRRISNLYFNEQAQINFQGKIGDKLNTNFNFDTKASFNFQNQMKLNWKTQEEDILQNIEVGNTAWTLNSQLIPGVQNLFGVKTLLRFGNLDVTLLAAQQRSKQDCITLRGGSQGKGFEIRADQYDENRHFFLSKYFRDTYEKNLRLLPAVLSGIQITRVEVYVTNRTQNTETLRNLVAFNDIDKVSGLPNPKNNDFFNQIIQDPLKLNVQTIAENLPGKDRGIDFDIIKGAKRLSEREFKFHPQLGYISLVAPLRNDEVLAVAFEYTLNGQRFKVGEMTEDYQARKEDQMIVLKLLKSSTIRNHLNEPKGREMWDLMMKNIYSLNTNGISKQGFQLRIVYKDDKSGIDNSNIIEGKGENKDKPWVEAMGFDRLNFAGDPQKDGNYDYVEELTIDSKNGKIILPVLEPFSSGYLMKKELVTDVAKYGFDELYSKTMTDAAQVTTRNKFFIKGSYQSGVGGDISLPFGVEAKSVTVSAGGQTLSQGTDFMVDPSGKVKILNESIFNSGREIRVCYERPDLFTNQVRTLLGTRLDYNLSKDVHLGATFQNMRETPPAFFRRVAIGNEPVNNTLLGFDASFVKKSNFLTYLLDKLPFVSTKEPSVIDFQGEYAKLIPSVNNRVQGNAFIDDFESARVIYNFSSQPTLWRPGSVPEDWLKSKNIPRSDLRSGYNRAKISAYTVDASIYGQGSFGLNVPGLEDVSKYAYERSVSPRGIFPGKDFANNITGLPLGVLDVAYFPKERGMYNYNPDISARNNTVLLNNNPKDNYGVITRAITSDTDFENANVETLEFWLMDPFISGEAGKVRDGINDAPNTSGGKLTFHLGDVSEDFIPDNYYNFENGIPANEVLQKDINYYGTKWGIAPKRQFVINAFDNAGRDKQDVGLDGLPNTSTNADAPSEESVFKTNFIDRITDNTAKELVKSDPSADDYEFYLDQKFTDQKASIIQRYKNFMGLEKNSPNLDSPGANTTTQANTIQPDREDLNNDNTINEVENYFTYEMDLKKGSLDNNPYVVDKVSDGNANWYLVRIPLRDKYPTGNFKSIRFMRMMLSEFAEPVVLRFAQLQLSGYSYRKFIGNLERTGGINNELEVDLDTKFSVGTANIEENSVSSGNAIPYVVPPGFVRDQDITTINNARLNEQSMSLRVENLKPNKSKAVFKNTMVDLINYKRLKMFVSMQEHPDNRYKNQDLSKAAVFIRLGTDVTDNYYEIEQIGLTPAKKSAIDTDVWPLENEFDIELELLKRAKLARNNQLARTDTSRFVYEEPGSKYRVYLRGNPDMSAILNVVIGIRNRGLQSLSCNIWVNELRTNGFDQTSGDAAIGKMAIKLADLGSITMNGAFRNYGFGGVQTKISERARDNNLEYGFSAALNLERFLPASWNLRIPFYITYDRKNISPQFDPFDPDIFLNDSYLNYRNSDITQNRAYAELIKSAAEDNSVRRGFNFSNVRKLRSNAAKHHYIWDLSNFTFNYAFSEMIRTSPLIADYQQNSYKGGFIYTYTAQAKFWEPFRGMKSNSNFAPLIKDFSLNFVPSAISVRMDMDRSFIKTQMRDEKYAPALAQFEKYWFFNRQYALNWNVTKSIVANYSSMAMAIIDEPYGDVNTPEWKQTVTDNIKAFGRTKNFDQQAGFVWRLPLQKSPITDWMNLDYSHKISYNYLANSLGLRDDEKVDGEFPLLGDLIKNGRDRSITGKVDFVSLYNRIKALRWVNTPKYASGKNVARSPGDEDELFIPQKNALKSVTRLLLTLRGIQVNYSINESTTLPGFLKSPGLFGMNGQWGAPGLDFVTGSQDFGILEKARANGWLTKSVNQNVPFTQIANQRFSYTTQLEPNKDLRIQVEGNYNKGDNYQEFFRYNKQLGDFEHQSPVRSGNYSMSFLSFMTAFKDPATVFENFRSNRSILLERLQNTYRASNGEGKGEYNLNSQEVLIPAFFAAYSGTDPKTVKYSPFYNIPLPNWRVDYNGLNLLPWITKKFSSFTINHSYNSTYSVGNFISSLEYTDYRDLTLNSILYPLSSRFEEKIVGGQRVLSLIPIYVMSTITFTERFAPLVGVNAVTKSKISLRFEYAQDRSVGLNLANSQVAELSNKDLTVAIGFTRSNLLLPISINGKRIKLPNDLRFNCNLTIRDTRTLQRKLDAETIVTQGFVNFQLRPQLSYNVSNSLSVTAYFDKMFNNPFVTNSFYRSTVMGGFQVRLTLND